VAELYRQIYLALKDDASAIAELRVRQKALALDCLNSDKSLETTSFSLNGQSASGQLVRTKADMLKIIGRVLYEVDNDCTLSTRTTGVRF